MKVVTPADVIEFDTEFAQDYHDAAISGIQIASESKCLVVGLARQIAPVVPLTIERLEQLSKFFADFSVHVVENDSTDGTPDLFKEWKPGFDVTVDSQKLDRPHLPSLRDADRTRPLAEYRQKCVDHAKESDSDYVIVMDYDAWGGFLNEGIMTSIHYLEDQRSMFGESEFFGMASVGLAQINHIKDSEGNHVWFNYDAWAHRPAWSWRQRPEMWYHYLKPPFGCPPIAVNSAFGGLAVYKTEHFVKGRYSGTLFGEGDCEHVPFHRSIHKATSKTMGLNPSSVGVMFWYQEQEQLEAA